MLYANLKRKREGYRAFRAARPATTSQAGEEEDFGAGSGRTNSWPSTSGSYDISERMPSHTCHQC